MTYQRDEPGYQPRIFRSTRTYVRYLPGWRLKFFGPQEISGYSFPMHPDDTVRLLVGDHIHNRAQLVKYEKNIPPRIITSFIRDGHWWNIEMSNGEAIRIPDDYRISI